MNIGQQKAVTRTRLLYRVFVHLLILSVLTGLGCTRNPGPVRQVYPEPAPEASVELPAHPQLTYKQQWQQLLLENEKAPVNDRIAAVNAFFNRLQFIEDRSLWGKEDYWATLAETLMQGGGDCEDLALAKYFTLLQLNIPDNRLRISYTISLKFRKAHMVLTYIPDSHADPLVLDTNSNYIFPVSRRPDLVPVYSFNRNGYWLAEKQNGWQGQKLGTPSMLSKWQHVLSRMRMQG